MTQYHATPEMLKEYLAAVFKEGSTDTWMDAFIDPFLDIGRTALYSIEKTGATVKSYIRRTLGRFSEMLIPFLKVEWDRFLQEEEQKLLAVDKKYGGVLSRNMAALQHQDLAFLTFLVSPQEFIASRVFPRSVETALELTLAFLPAWQPLQNLLLRYRELTHLGPAGITPGKTNPGFSGGGDWNTGGDMGYGGYDGLYDHRCPPRLEDLVVVLTEAPPQGPRPPRDPRAQFAEDLALLLRSPEFGQAIASSKFAYELHRSLVMDAVKAVNDFTRMDSPEKLKGRIGAGWANIDRDVSKIVNQTQKDDPNTQAATRQAFEESMVAAAQSAYKKMFVEKLAQYQQAHPAMASLYQWGISQIQKSG